MSAVTFLLKAGDLDGLEHVPGPADQTLGNQFQSVCRCGFKAKTGSSPSAAYKNCQSHVDEQYRPEAPETSPEDSDDPEAPTAPRASSRPARTPRVTGEKPPCRCGCGELTGGGLFRPGHDAKLLSKLAAAVASGKITAQTAIDGLAVMPKLQAKLRSRL